MKWYAGTIFLSSFLLFQIQPLIGKCLLPWFGGTPGVWTTCLLFFQLMLLAGYSYAHALVRFLGVSGQALVHTALVGTTLLLLPILPSESWREASAADPTVRILLLLVISVGGPYFVLSSTAPLMQAWFGLTNRGSSPYRLYAISNTASLLALLSYPILFERLYALPAQSTIWSSAYVLFAVTCGMCAWRVFGHARQTEPEALNVGEAAKAVLSWRHSLSDYALWLGLSGCSVIMLMATTNHLCQEVAAVPFLWILPLTIYLVTFIICFDRDAWYNRTIFSWMMISGVLSVCMVLVMWQSFSLIAQVAICAYGLLACCMSCHGELARSKPDTRDLTMFYLLIAAGGALGGFFVTVIAPLFFDGYQEYQLGLVATCLLVLLAGRHETWKTLDRPRISQAAALRAGLAVILITFMLRFLVSKYMTSGDELIVANLRDFYGTLHVVQVNTGDPESSYMVMKHGTTIHGSQYLAEDKRRTATTYYVPESGIGIAIRRHPKRHDGLRIGVIGLGAGTIAAYAEKRDSLCFYEINRNVVKLSHEHFSYQADAVHRGAKLDVFLGDARIVLEQQQAQGTLQRFDILAVDAFSSDSIPVHLITKECFDLYWRHLKQEGILAVHVSNRYLDLSPLVRNLAEASGKEAIYISYSPKDSNAGSFCNWILVTGNKSFLKDASVVDSTTPWTGPARPLIWTDDSSSLFSVLR